MTNDYEPPQRTLYRSRNGLIFGVCRGLADYLNVSANWMRIGLVVMFVFTGFWPMVIAYLAAALLMKPEPMVPFRSEDDAEFYQSYAGSRTSGLQRLKRSFDSLDRRIQRMEHIVTSREYSWDKRMNE